MYSSPSEYLFGNSLCLIQKKHVFCSLFLWKDVAGPNVLLMLLNCRHKPAGHCKVKFLWGGIWHKTSVQMWLMYLIKCIIREQENHGLHRKWLVKWMSEGNGRMSTLKKAGGTTGDWGTNWNEPQKRPKRNILRTHVQRLWNFTEQAVMIWCTWRRKN